MILEAKPKPCKPDEVDYLRIIAGLLERILAKPDPKFPLLKPPDVTVKPPEVTVNTPSIPASPPRIKKWKFALKKDFNGYTTEITATAIE